MSKLAMLVAVPAAVATLGAGTASAATVFTLEGGIVGMQHIWRSTPDQLQGKPCAQNTCTPIDYFALPIGSETQRGGQMLTEAINQTSPGEKVVIVGHSQGGQVIYSALRDWASGDIADPQRTADVTWISLGNPENKYGRQAGGIAYTNGQGVPADTDYPGYEVIRQYDGWADWPQDTSNLLAVANAMVGMQTLHTNYRDVNPDNGFAAYADTSIKEGNITYVWVPTDTLPLVAWTGPFAPALDNALRPIVEKAYDRPVVIPDPTPAAGAAITAETPEPTSELDGQKRMLAADEPAPTRSRSTLRDTLRKVLAKNSSEVATDSSGKAAERAAARAEKRQRAAADLRETVNRVVSKVEDGVKSAISRTLGSSRPADAGKLTDGD